MRIKYFLFFLAFSLSCYSQESLKISFSISKEKKVLFIHVINESDSILYILNDVVFLHRHHELKWSRVYMSDEKKEYYKSSGEMYFPVQPYTGEICFDKKRVLITPVPAKGNLCLDITGIKKDLFAKNKIYVKLELYFTSDLIQPPRKPMIVEQWVPVE
jgi:hypothetical protein